jgi:hypothetical protein
MHPDYDPWLLAGDFLSLWQKVRLQKMLRDPRST